MSKMDDLIKEIAENISGIWQNNKYDLVLGLQPVSTFFFTNKETDETISGDYAIVKPNAQTYILLRLIDEEGRLHDYVIHEVSAFKTLVISHEGEKIHFKNVSPDEYESGNY